MNIATKRTVAKKNDKSLELRNHVKGLGFYDKIDNASKKKLESLRDQFNNGDITNDATIDNILREIETQYMSYVGNYEVSECIKAAADNGMPRILDIQEGIKHAGFPEEIAAKVFDASIQFTITDAEIEKCRYIILASSNGVDIKSNLTDKKFLLSDGFYYKFLPASLTNKSIESLMNSITSSNIDRSRIRIIVAEKPIIKREYTKFVTFFTENRDLFLE